MSSAFADALSMSSANATFHALEVSHSICELDEDSLRSRSTGRA